MAMTYKRPPREAERPTSTRRRIAGERRPGASPGTARSASEKRAAFTRPKAALPKLSRRSADERPARRPSTAPATDHERPSRRMVAVAVVLLVAVLAVGGLLVRAQLQAHEEEQRAEALDSALSEAPARAEKAAAALLSYSHDSIDEDIARTKPFLTADYRKDYESTMRDVVAGPAEQTKAKVTAKVLSTAVVDAGPQRTDVLVFVDQKTESTSRDEPSTALNRAILTMVKRDGSWRVSNLKGL